MHYLYTHVSIQQDTLYFCSQWCRELRPYSEEDIHYKCPDEFLTGLHTLSLRQNILTDVSQLESCAFRAGVVFVFSISAFTAACEARIYLSDFTCRYAAVLKELILHDNQIKEVSQSTFHALPCSPVCSPVEWLACQTCRSQPQNTAQFSGITASYGSSRGRIAPRCRKVSPVGAQIPALSDFTSLQRLELSYNQIQSLQPLQSLGSTGLTDLYVANNAVQKIEVHAFPLQSPFTPATGRKLAMLWSSAAAVMHQQDAALSMVSWPKLEGRRSQCINMPCALLRCSGLVSYQHNSILYPPSLQP
jgi:Leucine-rich repeat (LRR) protein